MMVLLMFGLSITVAFAQSRVVGKIKASVQEIKRWGGWILILVGLWLIILGTWAEFFTKFFRV